MNEYEMIKCAIEFLSNSVDGYMIEYAKLVIKTYL
jgi:hypothetical protein